MLDDIGQDLDEARARIMAAREVLEAGPQKPDFRQANEQSERLEAELEWIEARIAVRAGTSG